jgi:hypothetical protein
MAFSDTTVETARRITGGKCEKCEKLLSWEQRGRTDSLAWEAHHRDDDPENDSVINCQILCWDCHSKTF